MNMILCIVIIYFLPTECIGSNISHKVSRERRDYSASSTRITSGDRKRISQRKSTRPGDAIQWVELPNPHPSTILDDILHTSIARSMPLLIPSHHQNNTNTDWNSCLNYTCRELKKRWKFPGRMPHCPGKNCTTGGGADDDGGGGGGNDDNGGGGGGGGGTNDDGGGGGGEDDDVDHRTVDDDSTDNDDDSNWLCRIFKICSNHDDDDVTVTDDDKSNTDDDNNNQNDDKNNNNDDKGNNNNDDKGNNNNDDKGNNNNDDKGNNNNDDKGNNNNDDKGNNNNDDKGNNNNDDNGSNNNDDDSSTNDDGGHNPDPYNNFNITRCSTYKNFWLWDLALTCQSATDLQSCQCVTASNLMSSGQLQCPGTSSESPFCPKDCDICRTCLKLLNCQEPTRPTSAGEAVKKSNLLFFVVAVLVGLLLGVLATMIHRQKRRSIDEDSMNDTLVPLGQHLDPEQVWLSPVT